MDAEPYWDEDFRPGLEAVVAASAGHEPDFSDPTMIAALRDPGPTPPPVAGLSFSDSTVPNLAGDHDIPVRIYRPHRPDPMRPAFLLFHGGGLSFGHLNTEHRRCVELVRRCGAVGVSVGFRMAPENPAPVILDDGYSALRWLAGHAAELDVDPRRIALTGSSGGGGLALGLAQLARDRGEVAPMLQLALYPNTDDRTRAGHVSRQKGYPIISARNIEQVVANLVPHPPPAPYIMPNRTDDLRGLCRAFIVVGQNDAQRDEGIEYAWRLIRADVVTELHVLPGVSHAFDVLVPEAAASRTAYDLMCTAFSRAAAAV